MTKLAQDQLKWLEDCADYAGDECKIWPFYRMKNGYGKTTRLSGKQHLAHRWICQRVHGTLPSPKHESAHSCGNGHLGCCTPRHVSWKTTRENALDRRLHGTAWMGGNKLVPKQVRAIRRLKGRLTQRQLAARFGVSQGNISMILSGVTWWML